MIDLNLRNTNQGTREQWGAEEIACAVIALLIWIPLAFLIGGLL